MMRLLCVLLATSVLASFTTPSRQQPDGQQQVVGDAVTTCWNVKTKSCTSCSEEGYDDSECKKSNSGEYSACVDDETICPNGAFCDAEYGTGSC